MLLRKSPDLQVSQLPIPCSLCQALTLGKHGTHLTSLQGTTVIENKYQ